MCPNPLAADPAAAEGSAERKSKIQAGEGGIRSQSAGSAYALVSLLKKPSPLALNTLVIYTLQMTDPRWFKNFLSALFGDKQKAERVFFSALQMRK
ncbi:MAG TPA: hypothetical protein DEH22_07630 [Chloroflexi bacterium]|nr:hypothetical protein [Chloroflexota bacterium]